MIYVQCGGENMLRYNVLDNVLGGKSFLALDFLNACKGYFHHRDLDNFYLYVKDILVWNTGWGGALNFCMYVNDIVIFITESWTLHPTCKCLYDYKCSF